MTAPTPLPLMSEEGTSFLNGSIKSDVYLRTKRAQTREWAILEVDRDRRSLGSDRLVALGVLVVAASILFAGIASFAGGSNRAGVVGLVAAALLFCMGSMRVAVRRRHGN